MTPPVPPTEQLNNSIHSIDKRVLVIETLIVERNRKSEEEHGQIMTEIAKIRDDLASVRIKASTTAAAVSIIIGFVIRLLTKG